jgi:hypothetical protein
MLSTISYNRHSSDEISRQKLASVQNIACQTQHCPSERFDGAPEQSKYKDFPAKAPLKIYIDRTAAIVDDYERSKASTLTCFSRYLSARKIA